MKLRTIAMVAAVGAAALGGGQVDAGQHDPTSPNARATSNRRVPTEFQKYLSTSVGEDTRCVVGKVTNGDGMNARPYVYLAKGVDGRLQWMKLLSMPGDYYEGRATHCVRSGDNLYVLLQVDTQAPRSLSQTILSIVKIRMHDGATLNEVSVPVPNTRGAYTSWVWDDDGFKRVGDEFLVTGRYRYMDAEDDLPFSTSIKM